MTGLNRLAHCSWNTAGSFLEAGEVPGRQRAFRPQVSVILFSLLCRTDKSTPLVSKGQPRGPGNYFIWNWALFLLG